MAGTWKSVQSHVHPTNSRFTEGMNLGSQMWSNLVIGLAKCLQVKYNLNSSSHFLNEALDKIDTDAGL